MKLIKLTGADNPTKVTVNADTICALVPQKHNNVFLNTTVHFIGGQTLNVLEYPEDIEKQCIGLSI